MLTLSWGLSGVPTQTAVVSCGVKPTNHDCFSLSVVPVLPAAGRPPASSLPAPVPLAITAWRIWVTPLATVGSRALRHWPLGRGSNFLSLVVMVSTREGAHWMSAEAMVASGAANLSGATLCD